MTLKSLLKKFFLGGEVLEKVYSPVNGEITVMENLFGRREMIVGKVCQSGGLVEKLWEEILNFPYFVRLSRTSRGRQFLILGLGAGTLAEMLARKFPEAKIVGVEIDPMVVETGKKYFGLGEINNLEIMIGDAVKVVRGAKCKVQNFDLIVVDLYLGQEVPKESESNDFLGSLGKILADGGMVVFNRLYYNQGHRENAEKFLAGVKNFFPEIKTKKAATNLLIFASN